MNDPVSGIDYRGYRINIYYDDVTGSSVPYKEMDFASSLIYENERQTLCDSDDYAGDNGVLIYLLYEADQYLARRIEDVIEWKYRRVFTHDFCYNKSGTREYASKEREMDAWRDELCAKYLDKLGVVYDDFSLSGHESHRGIAYILPKKIQEEWKGDKQMALNCIKAELETLDRWINGEVYGWSVIKLKESEDESEDEEPEDNFEESVWGYYGINECIEAAKEQIDATIHHEITHTPALNAMREALDITK